VDIVQNLHNAALDPGDVVVIIVGASVPPRTSSSPPASKTPSALADELSSVSVASGLM
jgi:hypothetical protein